MARAPRTSFMSAETDYRSPARQNPGSISSTAQPDKPTASATSTKGASARYDLCLISISLRSMNQSVP